MLTETQLPVYCYFCSRDLVISYSGAELVEHSTTCVSIVRRIEGHSQHLIVIRAAVSFVTKEKRLTRAGSTMAAQGLGWHGTWQVPCPRQRCLAFRPALPCRARPVCRLAPTCAHASVESMPRKPRPGEKKGVPRVLPCFDAPACCTLVIC